MAAAAGDAWEERDAELQRLRDELADVEPSLHRQALRLEEHDDPNQPVIQLAKQRIEELSARRAGILAAVDARGSDAPDGPRPADIEALLAAIPDLQPALRNATDEELAEILDAFGVTATYDKPDRRLTLTATLDPSLLTALETQGPPDDGRSQMCVVAGERSDPNSDLWIPVETAVAWPT